MSNSTISVWQNAGMITLIVFSNARLRTAANSALNFTTGAEVHALAERNAQRAVLNASTQSAQPPLPRLQLQQNLPQPPQLRLQPPQLQQQPQQLRQQRPQRQLPQ